MKWQLCSHRVTLMALAELGSPSSTSSSRTPPKPSWSCLSSSLSSAFLSFRLYLGLKPYIPSRTSIFGLLTSASIGQKGHVCTDASTWPKSNSILAILQCAGLALHHRRVCGEIQRSTSFMSHCFCFKVMSSSLVSSRISSRVRKCVSPFWCRVWESNRHGQGTRLVQAELATADRHVTHVKLAKVDVKCAQMSQVAALQYNDHLTRLTQAKLFPFCSFNFDKSNGEPKQEAQSPETHLHVVDYFGETSKPVARACLDVKVAARIWNAKEKWEMNNTNELKWPFQCWMCRSDTVELFMHKLSTWTFMTELQHWAKFL